MITGRSFSVRKRLRAFTLTELLVAIALVGVLFSMMAPVLARAKGKAFEVYSLNNLRNISVAQQLFASDHDDRLVPHAILRPPAQGAVIPNAHLTLWPDLLESYVGDRRVYQSPLMRCDPDRGIGYGMNLSVAGAFAVETESDGAHSTEIRNPAQTILFADAAFVTRDTMYRPANEWEEDVSRPMGTWTIRTPADPLWNLAPTRVIPRNGGRANVAFVDGHVESLTIQQMGFDKPMGHPLNWWDRY